jgi:hypothetical protein
VGFRESVGLPFVMAHNVCMKHASMLFVALALLSLPIGAQTAQQILTQAESQAASEHKNLLLVFSASWCVPCHMFESFLTDRKAGPIISGHFVVARFDVGERKDDKKHADTPGAVDLRASLKGADAGYPFLVMADAGGQPIVNSFCPSGCKPAGENIGYPATPGEIDWFMQMLRQSAPSISAKDTKTIRAWLDAHGHI